MPARHVHLVRLEYVDLTNEVEAKQDDCVFKFPPTSCFRAVVAEPAPSVVVNSDIPHEFWDESPPESPVGRLRAQNAYWIATMHQIRVSAKIGEEESFGTMQRCFLDPFG